MDRKAELEEIPVDYIRETEGHGFHETDAVGLGNGNLPPRYSTINDLPSHQRQKSDVKKVINAQIDRVFSDEESSPEEAYFPRTAYAQRSRSGSLSVGEGVVSSGRVTVVKPRSGSADQGRGYNARYAYAQSEAASVVSGWTRGYAPSEADTFVSGRSTGRRAAPAPAPVAGPAFLSLKDIEVDKKKEKRERKEKRNKLAKEQPSGPSIGALVRQAELNRSNSDVRPKIVDSDRDYGYGGYGRYGSPSPDESEPPSPMQPQQTGSSYYTNSSRSPYNHPRPNVAAEPYLDILSDIQEVRKHPTGSTHGFRSHAAIERLKAQPTGSSSYSQGSNNPFFSQRNNAQTSPRQNGLLSASNTAAGPKSLHDILPTQRNVPIAPSERSSIYSEYPSQNNPFSRDLEVPPVPDISDKYAVVDEMEYPYNSDGMRSRDAPRRFDSPPSEYRGEEVNRRLEREFGPVGREPRLTRPEDFVTDRQSHESDSFRRTEQWNRDVASRIAPGRGSIGSQRSSDYNYRADSKRSSSSSPGFQRPLSLSSNGPREIEYVDGGFVANRDIQTIDPYKIEEKRQKRAHRAGRGKRWRNRMLTICGLRWKWYVYGMGIIVLCGCIAVGVIFGMKAAKKEDKPAEEKEVEDLLLRVRDLPPLPKVVTIMPTASEPLKVSSCANPAQLWSCELPPELTETSLSEGKQVRGFGIELKLRDKKLIDSDPNVALNFAQSPSSNPTESDYESLKDVNDIQGNVLGEPTDFVGTIVFPTLLSGASTGVSSRIKRQINVPARSPASLFPQVMKNQPLRLFDRGLPTEHYGFHNYFTKTIYLPDINGPNPILPPGGLAARDAKYACVWAQTRFDVKIFTRLDQGTTVLHNTTTDTFSTTKSLLENFNTQPEPVPSLRDPLAKFRSMPYPVSISEDRRGSDSEKGRTISCYKLDERGEITLEGQIPVPEVKGEGTEKRGCSCEWRNWKRSGGAQDLS